MQENRIDHGQIPLPEDKPEIRDPGIEADSQGVRIPLKIDDSIIVRSLHRLTRMAKSRIIGAMHGEYILITEPSVPISERYWAVLDESFLCSYFNEGLLYNFTSRYRRELMENLVCIEYPKEVEVRKIRKHRRIRVNIETKLVAEGNALPLLADMTDISPGGCRLVVDQPIQAQTGTLVTLTFSLPNEALVNEIQAAVVRTEGINGCKALEIGCAFSGPSSESSKIINFCDFCTFFEV